MTLLDDRPENERAVYSWRPMRLGINRNTLHKKLKEYGLEEEGAE
jgi:DNA-binding protein Fis